ncbi:MAG TPA: hypothetical protein VND93_04265 [Myxococcales bacterium]|nr:hypothetical protein [Myxococcales bacterium]
MIVATMLLVLSQTPAPSPVRMGTHGMVLFGGGDDPIYASHIPMFRPPHDLQLVLRISLQHASWTPPASFSDTGYTLVPERLDLTALLEGRLTAFKAEVFRGNFEAGGVKLAEGVDVKVKEVVLSNPLSKSAKAERELTYFWLPGGFLLHRISGPPDFDHVLRVTPARFAAGIPFILEGRPNKSDQRLREKETVQLGGKFLTIQRELSFLVGPEFVVPETH